MHTQYELSYIKIPLRYTLDNEYYQCHQYQQNEQSPLILTHWTQNKTTTNDVGNPGPGLGQSQNYGRFKPVNDIPTLP